jgi:hypothetical protein
VAKCFQKTKMAITPAMMTALAVLPTSRLITASAASAAGQTAPMMTNSRLSTKISAAIRPSPNKNPSINFPYSLPSPF